MSEYGSYAQTYDETFSFFKDYSAEAVFLKKLIDAYQPASGRILDVACGTGSHIVELAALGCRCVALDLDPEILAIARHKAMERGASVETVVADMRDFYLTPPVAVAMNMFYSFQNALDNAAAQVRCLQSIRASLEPAGLLVMELLPEENNLRQYPPAQERRIHQERRPDGTELVVSSRSRIIDDNHKEIIFVYETITDGRCTNRQVMVSPFHRMYLEPTRNLFRQNGFRILAEYGDYSMDAPFSERSAKIIFVARKEE